MRMNVMKHGVVVGAVLLSVACGGGGGLPIGPGASSSSGGSSSGGEQPLTMRSALEQYFSALCDAEERCANTRGRVFSTKAACNAYYADREALYANYYGQGYYDYFASKYRMADEAAARRCLDNVKTQACDSQEVNNPDCDAAFAPSAPVAEGEICGGETIQQEKVCGEDTYCDYKSETRQDCTLCFALKANGQTCQGAYQCESGFCDGTEADSGTCAAPAFKSKGQSCARTDQCLGSLVCAGSGDQKTCQDRGGAGASCDGPNETDPTRPGCYADLACVVGGAGSTGSCTALLADGATCQRDRFSVGCQHLCIFDSEDATSGTCKGFTDFPQANSPCSRYQGLPSYVCDNDTTIYPDYEVQGQGATADISSCTCASRKADGAECIFGDECTSGRCNDVNFQQNPPTPGTCGDKAPNGELCFADSECEGGYCEPNPQQPQVGNCANALACP
ncbi:MAG: hypothetical protein AB2A00_25340 [Myxococcota bacterium]